MRQMFHALFLDVGDCNQLAALGGLLTFRMKGRNQAGAQ
jgi:hypothetical protein